jgi:hypothetical protein
MAEPGQFALHAAVSPGWILGCHPNHEILHHRWGRGTSGLAACGVVPSARDQLAMPGQDRGGCDREDLGRQRRTESRARAPPDW